MKNFLYTAVAIILFTPVLAWAIPSSIDRITDHIEPLIKTDYIKASFFTATSTTATSTFPMSSLGTTTVTNKLYVTGATSTFSKGIDVGANMIISHGGQADASDGWYLNAGNGTQIGLFGAGNTSNALFYGALNIDGNTRIATTTNGVLTATAGAITASGTPYVTSIVATGTTATSTFAGAVGIGTTTPIGKLEVANNTNGGNVSYLSNPNTGTGAYTEFNIRNANTSDTFSDGLRLLTLGTGWTSTGAFLQDGSALMTGTNLAGGLSLATLNASANMRFYTAGFADANERMRITSGGLVGIGTTSPVTTFAVNGSTTITSNLQVNGGTLFVDATNNRVGIATTTPVNQLSIVSTANRTPWMSLFDAQGARSVDVYSSTSTASSTGFGLESLQALTTGTGNTAFGSNALRAVTSGTGHTAVGASALRTLTGGTGNTAVGNDAGLLMTTGTANTAIGNTALRGVTTGIRNVGIGFQSLYTLTTGSSVIGIGTYSGKYLADGATNNVGATSSIYIGSETKSGSAGSLNEIVIGNYMTGYGTNTIAIGDNNITRTVLGGSLAIGTTTPQAMLSVMGTSSSVVAQFTTSSGVKLLEMLSTGSTTANGTWDFSNATVKQHTYKSFSFPTFATTTSATTTIDLGTAYTAESWSGADCYTTSGSGAFIFTDGTNRMNGATATTTVSRTTLSTNNTFTAQEKRYVEVGALTNAKLVCTVDIIVNN